MNILTYTCNLYVNNSVLLRCFLYEQQSSLWDLTKTSGGFFHDGDDARNRDINQCNSQYVWEHSALGSAVLYITREMLLCALVFAIWHELVDLKRIKVLFFKVYGKWDCNRKGLQNSGSTSMDKTCICESTVFYCFAVFQDFWISMNYKGVLKSNT